MYTHMFLQLVVKVSVVIFLVFYFVCSNGMKIKQ